MPALQFLGWNRMIRLVPATVMAIIVAASGLAQADPIYYGLDSYTGDMNFNPVADSNGAYVEVTASSSYNSGTNTTTVDMILSAGQSGATLAEFGFNTGSHTASNITLYDGTVVDSSKIISTQIKNNQNVDSSGTFGDDVSFSSNKDNPLLLVFTVSGNVSTSNILTENSSSIYFVAHLKPATGGTGFVHGGTIESGIGFQAIVPEPSSIVCLALGGFSVLGYSLRRRMCQAV